MCPTMLLALLALCHFATATSPYNVTFTLQGDTVTIRSNQYQFGHAFLGIPFVQPPVGDLRFKGAQPLTLSGFYEARERKPICAQDGEANSTEDCLYLNVFTPFVSSVLPEVIFDQNAGPNTSYPVFVDIHGGAFHKGESATAGQGVFDNILNRGPIIFVGIAYRLGIFGFYSTRDTVVPGNAALTDMIEALKWVQKYIRFFGGDPNKVTIGGASAGAIAGSFLTMTRKADNLFRAAALESGSAFLPLAMSYSTATRNCSKVAALYTKCATDSQWEQHDPTENAKIVDCLRGKTTAELQTAEHHVPVYDGMKWGMVQDTEYLPDRLENLALQRRPIPIIHGVNDFEWLTWMEPWVLTGNLSALTRQYVTDRLRNEFALIYYGDPEQVFEGAKKLYVDQETAADDDNVQWTYDQIKLMTEVAFTGPSFRDAKYFSYTGSKTYVYAFLTYPSELDLVIWEPKLRGPLHGTEHLYIFNRDMLSGKPIDSASDDYPLSQIMGKMWANFIITGDPTPATGGYSVGFTWETVDSGTNSYLAITKNPSMAQGYYPRAQYWVCNATAIEGHPPPFCK